MNWAVLLLTAVVGPAVAEPLAPDTSFALEPHQDGGALRDRLRITATPWGVAVWDEGRRTYAWWAGTTWSEEEVEEGQVLLDVVSRDEPVTAELVRGRHLKVAIGDRDLATRRARRPWDAWSRIQVDVSPDGTITWLWNAHEFSAEPESQATVHALRRGAPMRWWIRRPRQARRLSAGPDGARAMHAATSKLHAWLVCTPVSSDCARTLLLRNASEGRWRSMAEVDAKVVDEHATSGDIWALYARSSWLTGTPLPSTLTRIPSDGAAPEVFAGPVGAWTRLLVLEDRLVLVGYSGIACGPLPTSGDTSWTPVHLDTWEPNALDYIAAEKSPNGRTLWIVTNHAEQVRGYRYTGACVDKASE